MIDISIENSRMKVVLSGSLDTGNAASTQEQLTANISANNITGVILDLTDLNYISSAGLRVIFKIKQLVSDTQVRNASLAVFEVFNVSGLSELMSINRSLEDLSLKGTKKLKEEQNGALYCFPNGAFTKVYTEDVSLEEIEEEVMLAQSAFYYGAGNSITFDIRTCQGRYALYMERLAFESFTDTLVEDPDNFDLYMDKFFEFFTRFSQVEYPEDRFERIQEVLMGRIDTLEHLISGEEAATLRAMVEALKDGYDLINGELNPARLRIKDEEPVLPYSSNLAVGPEIYEVFCLQRYFTYGSELPKDLVERSLGFNEEWIQKIQTAFYERYFDTEDKEELAKKIGQIDLAATLEKYLYLATKDEERMAELADLYNENYLRAILIPRKDEIISLLKTL